ncbi:MAG: hypothetical protein OEZ43_01070 [Gammaproteobacteria bacterium]|nr:hypothetical protein [Gammaproteobacteria bacterium]
MIASKKTITKKLLLASALASLSGTTLAGAKISVDEDTWISLGAGLRFGVSSTLDGSPNGNSPSTGIDMQSTRLYISGQANKSLKFSFGTEKMWGEYGVLDAVIQYEPSKAFNVWAGRMLTPADRIEMNGPFYALSWNQYTVPLFPSDNDIANGSNGVAGTYGRDDGVTVWGTLAKFQYAIGVFDGLSGPTNGKDMPLIATRLAYNFLDMEGNPAYYTSSTYFGKGSDILTLGFSAQYQADGYGDATNDGSFTGVAVDALLEKTLSGGSALTFEGEYKKFMVDTTAATPTFGMFDGDSYFATVGFLLGGKMGPGQIQPYLRYTGNSPSTGAASSLAELGMNYVISGQNMKLNLNFTSGDANASGAAGTDSKTMSFGMQMQL